MSKLLKSTLKADAISSSDKVFYTQQDYYDALFDDILEDAKGNFDITEDRIFDMIRSGSIEELPEYNLTDSIISPLDLLAQSVLLNAPNKDSNHQMIQQKLAGDLTAKDRAFYTCLAMQSLHGEKSTKKPEYQKKVFCDLSVLHGKDCKPFWISRDDGIPDISLCLRDGTTYAFRTTCGSVGCSNPMCSDSACAERGHHVEDRLNHLCHNSGDSFFDIYHVFISPNQELAPYWIQNRGYLEQLFRMVRDVMEYGFHCVGSSVALHPWRLKKDYDLLQACEYLEEYDEYIPDDSPYFARLGVHFHAIVALPYGLHTDNYKKRFCKAFYELTGIVIHFKKVETTPNLVWKYVLSHAAICQYEGAKRTMPVFRSYSALSSRSIRKIPIGSVANIRNCKTCQKTTVDTLGRPSWATHKLHGFTWAKDYDAVLTQVNDVLACCNGYIDNFYIDHIKNIPGLTVPEHLFQPHMTRPDSIQLWYQSPVDIPSPVPKSVFKKAVYDFGQRMDDIEVAEFIQMGRLSPSPVPVVSPDPDSTPVYDPGPVPFIHTQRGLPNACFNDATTVCVQSPKSEFKETSPPV